MLNFGTILTQKCAMNLNLMTAKETIALKIMKSEI